MTAAASGIGFAIAHRFALHGASVYVLDLNRDAAESTVQQINEAGGKARACCCDVTLHEQTKSALKDIFAQERVHILVNNAGKDGVQEGYPIRDGR